MLLEQAFALDPIARKARLLDCPAPRDYRNATIDEIPGTADFVARRKSNGRVVVRDYKTGEYAGSPKTSAQLGFFAVCLHLLTGEDEIDVEYVYIHEDSAIGADPATLDAFDFDAIISRFAAVMEARATAIKSVTLGRVPTVNKGDGSHCKYCPAYSACPANMGLARQIVPELQSIAGQLTMMTPEQQGIAWMKLKDIGRIYDEVERGLKGAARTDAPPRLPNGKVLRPIRSSRRGVNAERALALAREYGATEAELNSCLTVTTFDAIRECVDKEST